jgi:mono/diheme cytochrome c family protein
MTGRWALAAGLLVACGEPRGGGGVKDVDPGPVPAELAGGEQTYQAVCLACHGPHGAGTAQGPPLVHPYYVPSHHADEAFRRAIRLGVVPHHWRFGRMPPIAGLESQAITGVIGYVRWLQRRRGIL